jgi:hypothetical protein
MVKKFYSQPSLLVFSMQAQDVLTSSNEVDKQYYGSFDHGENDQDWY